MVLSFVEMGTLKMEHEGKRGKPKKKGNGIFQTTRQGTFSVLSPTKDLDKNLICWLTSYSMEHGI